MHHIAVLILPMHMCILTIYAPLQVLGCKLIRTRDNPEYKYTLAFLGKLVYKHCPTCLSSCCGAEVAPPPVCSRWQVPAGAAARCCAELRSSPSVLSVLGS